MHNAELYGRVIRCNYAKPQAIKGGEQGWSMQPVWADADKYQEEIAAGEEEERRRRATTRWRLWRRAWISEEEEP